MTVQTAPLTDDKETGPLLFPSVEWFRRLGELMEVNRALHEHIGEIDCSCVWTVFDADGEGTDRHFRATFELYFLVDLSEVTEVQRAPDQLPSARGLNRMATGTRTGHFYIEDTCIGCGACEHACPGRVDAIYKLEDDFMGRFAIMLEACIDCGFCVPMCPVDCIRDARQAGLDGQTKSGWRRIRELQAKAQARS